MDMNISNKIKLQMNAVIDFFINSEDNNEVLISEIKERHNINDEILEELFYQLQKNDIAKPGLNGGFVRNKNQTDFTIGLLLRIVNASLTLSGKNTDNFSIEDGIGFCLEKFVWEKLDENINSLIDGITIEDIIKEHKNMNFELIHIFHI
jgi:Rrf2 family transcriptional regulator, cysteine metabolism repressor